MDDKAHLKKIKMYYAAIIAITVCSEMYFFPFQGAFRFSVGVVAISIILLLFDDFNEMTLSILTAISVLALRCLFNYLEGNSDLFQLLKINLPGSIYYPTYAFMFYKLKVRSFSQFPTKTIYTLSIIDFCGNLLESALRDNLNINLILYIFFIAILRSSIIYFLYYLIKRKEILIIKNEHQRRYNQLNALISNIQAEVFYLSKSKSDIEDVMKKAYSLYEKTKDNKELNSLALDVSREIHEIKKDYQRVLNGFRSYVDNYDYKTMNLKEIGSIIKNNLERYIQYQDKEIQVNIKFHQNLVIKNYFYIFTIINNLIVNAIEAIIDKGSIIVESMIEDDNLIIKVSDDGPGIDEDIKPFIFNPGFTTKYDSKSGAQSTGIGLSHIDYIVSSLGGNIEVESESNLGTSFLITIPINSLGG